MDFRNTSITLANCNWYWIESATIWQRWKRMWRKRKRSSVSMRVASKASSNHYSAKWWKMTDQGVMLIPARSPVTMSRQHSSPQTYSKHRNISVVRANRMKQKWHSEMLIVDVPITIIKLKDHIFTPNEISKLIRFPFSDSFLFKTFTL